MDYQVPILNPKLVLSYEIAQTKEKWAEVSKRDSSRPESGVTCLSPETVFFTTGNAGRHCWEKKNDENEEGHRGLDGNDRGSEVEEGDVGVGALVPVEVAGDEEEAEREMNKGGCWKKEGAAVLALKEGEGCVWIYIYIEVLDFGNFPNCLLIYIYLLLHFKFPS